MHHTGIFGIQALSQLLSLSVITTQSLFPLPHSPLAPLHGYSSPLALFQNACPCMSLLPLCRNRDLFCKNIDFKFVTILATILGPLFYQFFFLNGVSSHNPFSQAELAFSHSSQTPLYAPNWYIGGPCILTNSSCYRASESLPFSSHLLDSICAFLLFFLQQKPLFSLWNLSPSNESKFVCLRDFCLFFSSGAAVYNSFSQTEIGTWKCCLLHKSHSCVPNWNIGGPSLLTISCFYRTFLLRVSSH